VRSVWVGLAGFAGAATRYQLDALVSRHVKGPYPWGTFVVNVTGCLLLGFLVALLAGGNPTARTALTVGFVGAYTTFSTFALQAFTLGDDRHLVLAATYVGASVALGMVAVWAGMALGRAA